MNTVDTQQLEKQKICKSFQVKGGRKTLEGVRMRSAVLRRESSKPPFRSVSPHQDMGKSAPHT